MSLHIRSIQAKPLNARLGQTFAISSAKQDAVTSVLVVVTLSDGTTGHGECAPMRPFNDETQAQNLAAVEAAGSWLAGQDPRCGGYLAAGLKERLGENAPVRAGIEMAILDAVCRHWNTPLYQYFGGLEHRLETDYTISVGSAAQAARDARAIVRRGIKKIKVKIGKDRSLDAGRVLAIVKAAPGRGLILDANQAYGAREALALLKELSRHGVTPELFEQPVPREDIDGLAEITRGSPVPVCADESVRTPQEAARLVKAEAVRAINIKLMKSGLADARRIAEIARAAGLRLMIGGMVETRLSMTCAAHFAAGLGGFEFVDLDTPFFFARDPMSGPGLSEDGVYDLSRISAGIGVRPRKD